MTAIETARRQVDLYNRWIAADRKALQQALAAAERCQQAGQPEVAAVHRETARLCEELVEVQRRLLAHWQVQLGRCLRIVERRSRAEGQPSA